MNRRTNIGRTFQKAREPKKILKKMWKYLYKYKYFLLLALVLSILSNSLALLGPSLSGKAIDSIDQEVVDFKKVYYYAILMILFYVSSALLSYILSIVMIKISKKVVFKMREDCFSKIQRLPVSYFDNEQIGDIISKFSYDIDTINTSLSSDVVTICTNFITIVMSLYYMIAISYQLVLVFAITIPISILFSKFMLKKTHKLFRRRSQTLGELNGYIEEMITGIKTIKAYGKEEQVIDEFDHYNTTATEAAYTAEYYGSITGPGVNFVNNLSLSLICIFGALLNIYKGFSKGSISSFVLYSRKFSGPINEFANIFVDIQSALAAGERVFGLLESDEEIIDKPNAIDNPFARGKVEFENVVFGYHPDKKIIKNLSFKAESGSVIAIVGPTGGGKTTLVNLLMRFYDYNLGKIYLDGVDILDYKRDSLRKNFAMVLQDTWMFEGTVYENLSYGKEDATLEEVKRVSKLARIDHFITRLANGYDTVLVEGGVNISKGQKQLLTIARAMLLDAHILILDEATSNVDTRTEIKIQEAMKLLMKGKTCFIIAHRLSTIQNADLILVVRDGNIVEQGKHEELLENKGFYNELYYSQFK